MGPQKRAFLTEKSLSRGIQAPPSRDLRMCRVQSPPNLPKPCCESNFERNTLSMHHFSFSQGIE